jgi:hypothetical protein
VSQIPRLTSRRRFEALLYGGSTRAASAYEQTTLLSVLTKLVGNQPKYVHGNHFYTNFIYLFHTNID